MGAFQLDHLPNRSEPPELVPARMLNEHAYCPRLAYLEWVQGDFTDNADTVEGRFHHRKVDAEHGALPAPDDMEGARFHARSVMLSAPNVGLIARIDLIEADGDVVTPIDYKRGKAPNIPEGAWEPERVQLCAQALILEENGYHVDRGVLYFVASRQRVDIELDAGLRARTRELLAQLRESAALDTPPPPLVDSPKCPRCVSLRRRCVKKRSELDTLVRAGAAANEVARANAPAAGPGARATHACQWQWRWRWRSTRHDAARGARRIWKPGAAC